LSSMIRKQLRESFFLGIFSCFAVCILSLTAAALEINDNFSIDGFLDMSAGATIGEDDEGDTDISAFAGYDQLEVDFKFNFGELSAQADINGNDTITLEQAFISYALSDMVSITTGRFLSCIGFEAAEPTDMFQYSYSTGIPYPGYQNGVALSISPSDMIGVYASVVSGVWDSSDTDLSNPGFEAQVSIMPIEGLTAKVGFAGDIIEEAHAEEAGKAHDHDHDEDETFMKSEINAWVMYTTGSITVAGEVDILSNWGASGHGGLHFLGMANVGLTDEIAVTARFSGIQMDDEDTLTSVTVSPSYAINDNWGALLEVKQHLSEGGGTEIAVETIMTF
jgi:hypothetical protein